MGKQTLGQVISSKRKSEGLSQDELAEILHVTKGKLAHWESDETIPRQSMVGRLMGALRMSDAEASVLLDAVENAKRQKAQAEMAEQAIIDEQNAETLRLYHSGKALTLLGFGVAGFIGGCLFFFVTGSHNDFPWYGPFIIGSLTAGIPFGWDLIRDKSGIRTRTYYYGRDAFLIQFMTGMLSFILKFTIAYIIGITVFPVALLYHAYKAGRKGTVFKKLMCAALVLVSIFVGFVVFIFAIAPFAQ